MDALNWNLLYRWFCDLAPDAAVGEATVFTKNRERFERHGLVQKFFQRVVAMALVKRYASNDPFTVHGTLIQSWASLKSFRPREEKGVDPPDAGSSNPSVNFRGQKGSNETHPSTTAPEARRARICVTAATCWRRSGMGCAGMSAWRWPTAMPSDRWPRPCCDAFGDDTAARPRRWEPRPATRPASFSRRWKRI